MLRLLSLSLFTPLHQPSILAFLRLVHRHPRFCQSQFFIHTSFEVFKFLKELYHDLYTYVYFLAGRHYSKADQEFLHELFCLKWNITFIRLSQTWYNTTYSRCLSLPPTLYITRALAQQPIIYLRLILSIEKKNPEDFCGICLGTWLSSKYPPRPLGYGKSSCALSNFRLRFYCSFNGRFVYRKAIAKILPVL